MLRYIFTRILMFLATSAFSNASDPCFAYGELNNPYRSIAYVAIDGVDPLICDKDLQTGWYRFVNDVGGTMPERKVDIFHCGTFAPIWMRGQHPSVADGIVDRTACINYNDVRDGCLPLSIKVKKCNGSNPFYVYRLVPPHACQIAYCAGTKRPCPRGQSGLDPNCTALQKADFPYADVPVPNVTYLNDGQKTVTLKCDYDVPAWNNISFQLEWIINGNGSSPKICDDPGQGTCALLLHRSGYKLGDQIRCDIQAKYNTHPNNTWTQPKSSAVFFAGIEVEPKHLDVQECNATTANTINLRPTLPVRGEHVSLKFGTWDNSIDLLTHSCEIVLPIEEESRTGIDVSIQALCDNNDRISRPVGFSFAPVSHPFWSSYNHPPIVTVTKIENPVKTCIATGDPHYTTFDGLYYDFYRPGDFVLYRNRQRAFEVHTRLWHCGSGVTCNCGVAIQEKRDVFVLSTCTHDLTYRYGMPMKVHFASKRQPTRGTQILVRHPGGYTEYKIRLPSGTLVKIKRYSWGNNVQIDAPRFDRGHTEGMCGNSDDEQNNDFVGGDGNSYTNADDFGESWRVNSTNSLFDMVPDCNNNAICDDSELNMDRCLCEFNENSVMTIKCSLDLMQFTDIDGAGYTDETATAVDSSRKKRDIVYSDDIIYLYDDYEPEGDTYVTRVKRAFNTRMSLENATNYCRKTILNTAAAKVCLEMSGVNASSAIQSCAADLQLTGDLSWVEAAFEGLKAECAFQAVKNYSGYDKDENGNFVPPIKIAQNLCPNDCSFNGNCTNGSCICNEGFVSADCSMRFDEIPRLFRILDKGMCDIRTRPCRKTIVFGEHFMDLKNLTCHVKEFSVIPSKWIPSNKTKRLYARKTDLFAIECHLPKPPMNLGNFDVEGSPAAGYMISVSNDKVHESQEVLKLITFDSVCMDCNVSQGCSLKRGSCLIRSHCFSEGDASPKDWCQQCNTKVSQTVWTRRTTNLPPNITTPSQRYALLGEDLQLQLEGEDPEKRPFIISLLSGNPPGARLTSKAVLFWKPQSAIKETFYFQATDECNASSTFQMTIEIITCPCTDKGSCKPDPNHPRGSGMYYCECQPGYEGARCEREIDECLSQPCVHGTCIDVINNYTCRCQPGYTGYNCSIEVDECQPSPCVYGTCTDLVNAFSCACQPGFTGLHCGVNIDDCPSLGCGNGTCRDLIQNYSCLCNAGFSGRHCNITDRNCSDDSCFPGVRCIQKPNIITCDPCPIGFTGDGKNCKDIDECVNHTCANGGACIDGVNNYTCNCVKGFTGERCEKNINDCLNVSCQYGGSCVDGINNFTCYCRSGYTGLSCETDIDECVNHVCANGGFCIDGVNNYTCNCLNGFTGERCERNIDECVNHTCANGGSCIDGVGNYTCNCSKGFTGERCEKNTNDCLNVSCQHGASCVDGINNFTCYCRAGYTGLWCETDVDDCSLNKCGNGSTCVDGVGQYTCICEEGYTGMLCESALATTKPYGTETRSTEKSSSEGTLRPSSTTPTTGEVAVERKTDFTFEIRISKDWDDRLQDTSSVEFKELAQLMKTEISKTYSGNPELKEIEIISMRKGSIIAKFQLTFRTKVTAKEAMVPLRREIADGKMGSLDVDPSYLKQTVSGTPDNDKGTERKSGVSLPFVIGISCGSLVLIGVLVICVVAYCKRAQRSHIGVRVGDGMPTEEAFPKREKYELKPTEKTKENVLWIEDRGLVNEGME